MSKTVSASEFRKSLRQIAEICRTTGEPVFVTVDGQKEMVVLDPSTHWSLANKARNYDRLLDQELRYWESVRQAKAEQTQDSHADDPKEEQDCTPE